jgi:hypothetical protein
MNDIIYTCFFIPEKFHYEIREYDKEKDGFRVVGHSVLLYHSTISCSTCCIHDSIAAAIESLDSSKLDCILPDGKSVIPFRENYPDLYLIHSVFVPFESVKAEIWPCDRKEV